MPVASQMTVLFLALLAAVSTPEGAPSPADATTRWSEHRLFRVRYVSSPAPVPLLAVHSWTVTIVDPNDQPVSDAQLTVLGGMPEHAHGLPTVPQVTSLGDGRYLVEGLKFHMPGAWVVAFRIKAGAVTDSVRFELAL
jgi:hypothetical protein